jgi:hypothetical protein
MSAAFVPGCIRRLELASSCVCSCGVVWGLAAGPPDGDLGPIWISAAGGGLGSRGELGASDMAVGGVEPQCRENVHNNERV